MYKPKRSIASLTVFEPTTLCDAGEMFYQLNYEATQLEAGWAHVFLRKDSMNEVDVYKTYWNSL